MLVLKDKTEFPYLRRESESLWGARNSEIKRTARFIGETQASDERPSLDKVWRTGLESRNPSGVLYVKLSPACILEDQYSRTAITKRHTRDVYFTAKKIEVGRSRLVGHRPTFER